MTFRLITLNVVHNFNGRYKTLKNHLNWTFIRIRHTKKLAEIELLLVNQSLSSVNLVRYDMTTKKTPATKTLSHSMDHSFRRFRLGLALFFLGFVILYAVEQLLQPSLLQEILAAFAVVIVAVGFGLAVVAELLFLIYRVVLFFSSK
jgi:hypothetical protein